MQRGHDVRVVMIDGAPWWVAADVCRVLSLQVTRSGAVNVTAACRHLDPAEGMLLSKQHCGARRGMFGISESGLYKLIMRSDKPEARAFQDWVTRVVLPAILRLRRSRSDKDGAYIMSEEKVATGEVSSKSIADLVVPALGKKGLLGDVEKQLEFLRRRAAIEDFRPTFTAATIYYAQAPASALLFRLDMGYHNHTARFVLAMAARELEEMHRGSVSA